MISMKQNLYHVARFVKDLFVWCPESMSNLQSRIVHALFPLIMDSCTEILSNLITLVLEKHIGVPESDEYAAKVFAHVLENTFETLLKPVNKDILDEKILIEVVHYMEEMLDKPVGRTVMDSYFDKDKEFGQVNDGMVRLLLSMSRSDLSPEFAARVLR